MLRLRVIPVVVTLILLLSGGLGAQAPTTGKTALIREMLALLQVAEQSLAVMEKAVASQRMVNPDIPAVFWDRFVAKARERKGELIDRLVPVYDAAFSEEDLRNLIAFYRSPLGKRLLDAQPGLVQASMEVGEEWGALLGQEVGEEMSAEGEQ